MTGKSRLVAATQLMTILAFAVILAGCTPAGPPSVPQDKMLAILPPGSKLASTETGPAAAASVSAPDAQISSARIDTYALPDGKGTVKVWSMLAADVPAADKMMTTVTDDVAQEGCQQVDVAATGERSLAYRCQSGGMSILAARQGTRVVMIGSVLAPVQMTDMAGVVRTALR